MTTMSLANHGYSGLFPIVDAATGVPAHSRASRDAASVQTVMPMPADSGTNKTSIGLDPASQPPTAGPAVPPTNAAVITAPKTVPVSPGKRSPATARSGKHRGHAESEQGKARHHAAERRSRPLARAGLFNKLLD